MRICLKKNPGGLWCGVCNFNIPEGRHDQGLKDSLGYRASFRPALSKELVLKNKKQRKAKQHLLSVLITNEFKTQLKEKEHKVGERLSRQSGHCQATAHPAPSPGRKEPVPGSFSLTSHTSMAAVHTPALS